MIINNINKILPFLPDKRIDNIYYDIQIIRRRKDNPNMSSNNICTNSFRVRDKSELTIKMNELILLSEFHNGRVYISLNRKNLKKMATHIIKKIATYIEKDEYNSLYGVINSVGGGYCEKEDKKWIIDLDFKEIDKIQEVKDFINTLLPLGNKIISEIPTINGIHLITRPFNKYEFNKKYPDIDIQKNNPTLLYYNKK